MSEWKPAVIAARGLQPDENYKVGDKCRESLAWDEEYGQPADYTIGGTCGISVVNCYAEFDKEASIKIARKYGYPVAIIGGNTCKYGKDEHEVIIPGAIVLEIIEE